MSYGHRCYTGANLPGIAGAVKLRFSDFLVNEIRLSGDVVELTNTQVPPELKAGAGGGGGGGGAAAAAIDESMSADDIAEKAEKVLGAMLCEEDVQKIAAMIKTKDVSDGESIVNLQTVADKDKRTAIHKFIRENFGVLLDTDTIDGATPDQKTIRVFFKKSQAAKKRKAVGGQEKGIFQSKFRQWEFPGKLFVKFTLVKENQDTINCVSSFCNMLRLRANAFSYAGTKDRRGVTVQEVTAFRVLPERLASAARGIHGVAVGNFSLCESHLKLGMLAGNQFQIAIRNVVLPYSSLVASMEHLQQWGFVNYFGSQRFGSFGIKTHEIGLALVREDFAKVCDLILCPREERDNMARAAREYYATTKDAAGASKKFPRACQTERLMLDQYAKNGPNGHLQAIKAIPYNLRLLYLHSYQSLIWNEMVSRRIEIYGAKHAVAGDLVLVKDAAGDEKKPSDTTNDTKNDADSGAAADEAEGGADAAAGGEELAAAGEEVSADAFDSGTGAKAAVRIVTAEEAESIPITDVILPLPGFESKYPTNEIGELYRKRLAEDGLDIDNLERKHKESTMHGGYRHILTIPNNVGWSVVEYTDPQANLQLSEIDKIRGKSLDGVRVISEADAPLPAEGTYRALLAKFCLRPSQYATMALREIMKEHTDESFKAQSAGITAPPPPPPPPPAAAAAAEENADDATCGKRKEAETSS